jgi:peptide/nickel transport system substrate-binding protein
VVRAELYPGYHVPNRPYFDTLEMKGGGDAVSAARAVLQTGEYDYAWNLQVEDDILVRLEQGSKGRVNLWATGNAEHIQLNTTDPWTEVDGERSSLKTTHPLLSDPAVRQALNLLVDRAAVQEQIYGRQGQTTANYLNAPPRFRSTNLRWEFNVEKAAQILEGAGWKKGGDGIRSKDGKRLKILYQTSINAPRQKNQQIVKQAAARAGIEVELKSVTASVFFSSDPANPDTYPHFYSDIQMYTNGPNAPDPQYFMNQFVSWEVASKANKWQGRNITRWRNEDYDRAYSAADVELDPVKRAALFVKMNDLLIQNVVLIPVLWRNGVSASATNLRGMDLSGWESTFWRLSHWTRQG